MIVAPQTGDRRLAGMLVVLAANTASANGVPRFGPRSEV
jgi:hypothetical protein